jgi:hypothetical protein
MTGMVDGLSMANAGSLPLCLVSLCRRLTPFFVQVYGFGAIHAGMYTKGLGNERNFSRCSGETIWPLNRLSISKGVLRWLTHILEP